MSDPQRPWVDAQHPATDSQRPWIEELAMSHPLPTNDDLQALEFICELPPGSLILAVRDNHVGAVVSALTRVERRLWHLERKLNATEDAEGNEVVGHVES